MNATARERSNLTGRQREVLDLLSRPGPQPTLREMAAAMGTNSPNGMIVHLAALERKGWIRRRPNRARSIEILRRPPAALGPMPPDVRDWLEPRVSPELMAAIDAELLAP